MFWFTMLVLLVLGALAAAGRVLGGSPDGKRLLRKAEPGEGIAGLVGVAWGVISIVYALVNIGVLGVAPIHWILSVLVALLCLTLGFVLAYPLLRKHVLTGSAAARDKANRLNARLAPMKESLGMSALLAVVLSLLLRIF